MEKMANFPKLTEQTRQGNVGIEIVSSIVNNELKWLFRRVHHEDDFGIDGYIDIVLNDGSVTGQSLAVQIKSGESFLSKKTTVGFVFYGESKHLNYYLNCQIPILIILCDPNTRRCYWELFEAHRTERTAAGWKMTIPATQIFDEEAKQTILSIVGPALDHREELEKHWAFNELLSGMGLIHFAIDRQDIEKKNINPVVSFFDRVVSSATLCEKLQGKVDISVFGYESDSRELWQVPEVRSYFERIEPEVKYWFYFLDLHPPAAGLCLLFGSLCEVETSHTVDAAGKRKVELSRRAMAQLIEKNFTFLNEMTHRLGMSVEQNKRISLAAMKILLPDYRP